MKITKEELLKRGFKENTWKDEGEVFTEYYKHIDDLLITFTGEDLKTLELFCDKEYINIPNCTALSQLDALIEMFKTN